MSLTAKVARFLQLTRENKRLFLAALLWLPLVGLGLRLFRFRTLQAFCARRRRLHVRGPGPEEAAYQAGQVARMVSAAARHGLYRGTCLPVALTVQRLLGRRGIVVELRLGVRTKDGKLEAHAWIEHLGLPVAGLEDVDGGFAPFEPATDAGTPP